MNDVQKAIEALKSTGITPVRQPQSFQWGDIYQCVGLFQGIFCNVDQSIDTFEVLPEYNQIVRWMTDTKGKGLFLSGDCGRGKSVIIIGIIPILLRMKRYITYPVQAQEFESECPFRNNIGYAPKTNLDYLIATKFPIIDDLGAEIRVNNYGEKYEGFNRIIDAAEARLKPMFISSNLSREQLLDRYGERAFDRARRLCKYIEFKGESLRK